MAPIIKKKKASDINRQDRKKETLPKIFHLNIIEKDKQMEEFKMVTIVVIERIYNQVKYLPKK